MTQAQVKAGFVQFQVSLGQGRAGLRGTGGRQQAFVKSKQAVFQPLCQPKALAFGITLGVIQRPEQEIIGLAENW